jgi:hypothetical protein
LLRCAAGYDAPVDLGLGGIAVSTTKDAVVVPIVAIDDAVAGLSNPEAHVGRDRRVVAEMTSLGWRTIIFWEYETSDLDSIARKLRREIDRLTGRLSRRAG